MLKLISATDISFYSVIDYYKSFSKKEEISYFVSKSNKSREEYLDYILSNDDLYYLVDDDNPTYILGNGEIYCRDEDSDEKHALISYVVRENERCKGNGTKLLDALIDKCRGQGYSSAYIYVLEDNIPSNKVISDNNCHYIMDFYNEKLGGKIIKYGTDLKQSSKKLVKSM